MVRPSGNKVDPCLAPHPAPDMLDRHMTRYDYDYHRDFVPIMGDEPDHESGHSRNRPLFARGPTLDWKSTMHSTFKPPLPQGSVNLLDLAKTAAASRDIMTAHGKNRTFAGCKWEDPTTISTYKAHYTPKWSTPSNGGAPYAGSSAVRYNPDLLKIDSVEDDNVGKPTRRRHEPAPASTGPPLAARPQDHLTVFGPCPTDGQPWETENSVIGDPRFHKPSLLPRAIETLKFDPSEADKNALIHRLAGKKLPPSCYWNIILDETRPIPMSIAEADRCHVANRLELEGPVKMSITKSDFVRQQHVPELVDPPIDKGIKAYTIVSKHPAPPPMPEHPSRKRCQEMCQGNFGDPHAHKSRRPQTC